MTLKTIIFLFILGTASLQEQLPQVISWKDLKDVRFRKKLNPEVGMVFLYPEFGLKVKTLSGKELIIKGYTIPINTEGTYVISQYPMSQCFFCGGAGPESMIELRLKKNKRFKTDEIHTFKGKLRLNPDNIEELNYVFEEAELVD
ncbi:MAG: DUF3299 domain-containing protein [Arcicella sp.]|nr:DUF3299 domain-containing protein [Arcicella sp.]